MSEGFAELNDSDFEGVLAQEEGLVVVDFWSTTCVPCKRILPMLADLQARYGNRVKFAKANMVTNKEFAAKYNVKGVPTLLFIRGGEVVEKLSGVQSKSKLVEVIEGHCA